jgi:hypothetical protein
VSSLPSRREWRSEPQRRAWFGDLFEELFSTRH